MARFEVTLGEWLEFLNDPKVKSRIAGGELSPSSPEVARELEENDRKTLRAVPLYQGKPLFTSEDGGGWTLNASLGMSTLFPALGVCQLGAREYAHWLTARARAQGRAWFYRLPTDLEWEWAARGADRRVHVWGNYPAWNFCWSYPGNFEALRKPGVVGVSPLDESVFGVRDLAGSVCEHTADRIAERSSFTSYRGGSWYTPDEKDFRIASRRGMLPWNARMDFGFRLVVDLPGDVRR